MHAETAASARGDRSKEDVGKLRRQTSAEREIEKMICMADTAAAVQQQQYEADRGGTNWDEDWDDEEEDEGGV